jgi:hypothetical protein
MIRIFETENGGDDEQLDDKQKFRRAHEQQSKRYRGACIKHLN